MISVDCVYKNFGKVEVLKGISCQINQGEIVAIIGPSGCGKTTLLSLAAGLLHPTKGKVNAGGVSFGYMLQKDELFPWRTIEKNFFLPLEIILLEYALFARGIMCPTE